MSYIIKVSAAKMPQSCWGRYARIAVLEVEPGVDAASMISERARGVRRIVRTWERLNVGSTDRCAFARAEREAEALVERLSADEQRRARRRAQRRARRAARGQS
jgi:hypothetical protein